MTNGHQTREENEANHKRARERRAANREAERQRLAALQPSMAASKQKSSMMPTVRGIGTFLLLVCFLEACGYLVGAMSDLNKQRDAEQAAVKAQWKRWVTYRDANCKVVENQYGFTVGTGKGARRHNGTVWECANGQRYAMADYIDQRAQSGEVDATDFPDIK